MKTTFTYEEIDNLAVDLSFCYAKAGMAYSGIVMYVDLQTLENIKQETSLWQGVPITTGLENNVVLLKLLCGITVKLVVT